MPPTRSGSLSRTGRIGPACKRVGWSLVEACSLAAFGYGAGRLIVWLLR